LRAEESNAETAFKSFAKLMLGGVWKHEDRVHRYRGILGDKFLERTEEGGDRSAHVIIGVDPVTSKMTLWRYSSLGAVGKVTMSQDKEGVWNWTISGTLPGGVTFSGKGRTTKVSNNEVRVERLEAVIGDEKPEPYTATWTRHKE
jgi:hypothetical protein